MASEHLQDIIHPMQTVIPAVSVRAYYVQTAAVSVWEETVYLVAELRSNSDINFVRNLYHIEFAVSKHIEFV